MSAVLTTYFFQRQVTVLSRLPNSAGAENPLWAKWIESAFKKFSWRARIVLRVNGKVVVVTGEVDDWS